MASILPGSPPGYDRNNPQGTVKALCSYAFGLHEALDFRLGQFKKDIDHGKTDIASTQKAIDALQRSVDGLSDSIAALDQRVSALEQSNT